MQRDQYGISTWICQAFELERALQILQEHGFRLLEVWGDSCHLDPRTNPDISAFARRVERSGCAVHSLHAPFTGLGLSDPTRPQMSRWVDCHERLFNYAAELGAEVCVVHLTSPPCPVGPDHLSQSLDVARGFVENILLAAERTGVRIALENLPARVNPEFACTLAELVRHFPDRRIGFCLDVGHVLVNGADMRSEIAAAAGRLLSVHLSSNDGRKDLHWPPALGVLDWVDTRSALSCAGYDGPYILEISGGDDALEVLQRLQSHAAAL